jgi:transcription initiation factor TFIID subunit 7
VKQNAWRQDRYLALFVNNVAFLMSSPSSQTKPIKMSTPAAPKPKLKLKFGSSAAVPTLASAEPTSAKASPTIKIKKRQREDDGDAEPSTKKQPKLGISISLSKVPKPKATPKIKLKASSQKLSLVSKTAGGYVVERKKGYAYDSEADDVEPHPMIEHQFIVRMIPGDDAEYLRKVIGDRLIGTGGADVKFRFFDKDGRKAMVSIRGNHYAANVVDLPCIVEAHKTWDRKNFMKAADIHQMLLVTKKVKDQEEARRAPLPEHVSQGIWQYPHGLTPPMHWVRKRRFRKRLNRRTIEAVEDEVERLLKLDIELGEKGGASSFDLFDPNAPDEEEEYDDEDADGEIEESIEVDDENQGLEDEMMALFGGGGSDDDEPVQTPLTGQPNITSLGVIASPETLQPGAKKLTGEGDADSGDDGYSDDGVDSDEDMDEDERAALQERAQLREEVDAIRAEIDGVDKQMAAQSNKILKSKLQAKKEKLRRDLEIKLKNLGEEDDGSEED